MRYCVSSSQGSIPVSWKWRNCSNFILKKQGCISAAKEGDAICGDVNHCISCLNVLRNSKNMSFAICHHARKSCTREEGRGAMGVEK